MDSAQGMFKNDFNNKTFADCKIVLRHEVVVVSDDDREAVSLPEPDADAEVRPTKRARTIQPLESDRQFYAHRLVLGGHSEVFKRQLSAWSEACAHDAEDNMPVLILQLEEQEVEVMEHVLRLMYSFETPSDASGTLLVSMLRLSDMYEATRCIAALASAFATRSNMDNFSAADMHDMLSLPQALLSRQDVDAAVARCKQAVVQQFMNVTALAQDRQLHSSFLQLDFPVVLAWAQEDSLRVYTENEVLLLLHSWVTARGCRDVEQLKQLSHSVRIPHLTPVYMTSVARSMVWFQCSEREWRRIAAFQRHLELRSGVEDEKFLPTWELPKAWSTAEHRTGHAVCSRTLAWEVDATALYDGRDVYCPDRLYHNGMLLQPGARVQPVKEAAAATVSLKLFIGEAAVAGLPHDSTTRHIDVQDVLPAICPEYSIRKPDGRSIVHGCDVDVATLPGWGPTDMLGHTAATPQELLQPFLIDGKLHINVMVKYVL